MYSLSFTGILKQYRTKIIWSPPGIERRTACLTHKRSATELHNQLANKHSNSVFILGTAMLQSHSQQTNENSPATCVKQVVLGSIPGGSQIFLILYCLKIPVKEREYI